MTLGEKLSQLRIKAHLSQEQLANSLGVTRQSISKWEIDVSTPQVDKVLQICKIFNVEAGDLLDDKIELKQLKDRQQIEENTVSKYFGVNGFSGEANLKLTSDHAYKIGRFLGWYYSQPDFNPNKKSSEKARILIGKDTRRSSYMFEYALCAGIVASGADAFTMHVITIAGVALMTRSDSFDCGVMISGSDSLYSENGIQIMNSNGEKIGLSTILLIEAYLDGKLEYLGSFDKDIPFATKDNIGSVIDYVSGRNRYIGHLIAISSTSFRGLKIGLDAANGATWMIADNVFRSLGAQTFLIGNKPDGLNNNDNCGSSNPETLGRFVKENHLDMGFAFDGDGDRCIAVDENGRSVSPEAVIYFFAKKTKEHDIFSKTVFGSYGCNLALQQSLNNLGFKFMRFPTSTSFSFANMSENGCLIAGDSEGEIILSKFATLGDGILTAIFVVQYVIEEKTTLARATSELKLYPQIKKLLKVNNKKSVLTHKIVLDEVEQMNKKLGTSGRFLMLDSSVESHIRVISEGPDKETSERNYTAFCNMLRKYKMLSE